MKALAPAIENARQYLSRGASETLDDGLTVLGEPMYALLNQCTVIETARIFGQFDLPIEIEGRGHSTYTVHRMVAFQLDECRFLILAEITLNKAHDRYTIMYFYDASMERVFKFRSTDHARIEKSLADPANASIWTRD